MFSLHFFSYSLISLIGLSKVRAQIQVNVIKIDIFDFLVDLPISSAISDSDDQAYHLSNIPANHND